MSSNLLRPIFARTFRDYPISMASVKVKRLTCSIPDHTVRVLPRPFNVEEEPGERQTLKDRAASRTRGGG
jgi:hypothetical protein